MSPSKSQRTQKPRKQGKRKLTKEFLRDKHVLYTAAVQSVDTDLDFFERIYRKRHKKRFTWLKEDFCGTAALASDWVKRRKENHAIGVDLDRATLDWGIEHYVSGLGDAEDRLTLLCEDVCAVKRPRVDVVAALNFSYSVFKTRRQLGDYFTATRRSLKPGGMLFLDALGGSEAMEPIRENRRIPASKLPNGVKVPAFRYTWDQASFNPVDHDFQCRIHFKAADGHKLKKAFTYDWRFWTLPELRELLEESGFADSEVYVEGWDDKADDTDGIFRKRRRFDNQSAWIAYVVGIA